MPKIIIPQSCNIGGQRAKDFFKKQRHIESLIYDYLDNLKMTEKHFSEALNTRLKEDVCGDFDFLAEQTHKFESKKDN